MDEFVAKTSVDQAQGRLYDTGLGYPGAVFGNDSSLIQGFVLELIPDRAREASEVIATENNIFRAVEIETENGIHAIAYERIMSVAWHHRAVHSEQLTLRNWRRPITYYRLIAADPTADQGEQRDQHGGHGSGRAHPDVTPLAFGSRQVYISSVGGLGRSVRSP